MQSGRYNTKAKRLDRGTASQKDSQQFTRGPWPELRIVRKANYEAAEARDWNLFLNDIGNRNYGKGHAKSLGSIACVFVDAQAMGRMLSKKYDRAFEDRRRTQQVQRSFARDFNEWVRAQEKLRIDAQFEKKTAPHANCRNIGLIAVGNELVLPPDPTATAHASVEDISYDIELDDALLPDLEIMISGNPDELRWNQASFAVRGFEKYGHNDIGLDLSTNEQLYCEWEDIRSYLIQDGLDVNHMKDKPNGNFLFEPHASFFETCGPAGQSELQYKGSVPKALPLDSPHAYVSK